MPAKTLSILNMKGGVGKTTISTHVFRALYLNRNKKVLLIDLDAQFNLTQSILVQSDYDVLQSQNKTIMSCFEPAPAGDFFAVKKSAEPPSAPSAIRTNLKHLAAPRTGRLDLIAGDFKLVKYSLIDDPKQLRIAYEYFKKFVNICRSEYDLIVFDCNPSSSFITKCALDNSGYVLSPVRPDKYSVIGVDLVDRLFSHLGLNIDHRIVMNGLSRSAPPTSVENELRAHPKFGSKVLVSAVYYSKLLHAGQANTGFATDRKTSWSGTVRKEINNVANELAAALGL